MQRDRTRIWTHNYDFSATEWFMIAARFSIDFTEFISMKIIMNGDLWMRIAVEDYGRIWKNTEEHGRIRMNTEDCGRFFWKSTEHGRTRRSSLLPTLARMKRRFISRWTVAVLSLPTRTVRQELFPFEMCLHSRLWLMHMQGNSPVKERLAKNTCWKSVSH